LHQNKMQGKNVSPQVEFTGKACEEKEKWIRGESYGSQMCSCQKWNIICLDDLAFYFGIGSRWSWTRHQKKGDTIWYVFMLFNKGKPMTKYEDFKPLFSFLKLKKIWKIIRVTQLGGRLLNMFTTRF
jgi:hypothetical protein